MPGYWLSWPCPSHAPRGADVYKRQGIIVESVAPYEPGNIQDRVRADGVRPRRREVEGLDLGALVGRPQRRAAHRIHDQRATEVMGLLIVGIGILKPRARVAKIQMKRVRG